MKPHAQYLRNVPSDYSLPRVSSLISVNYFQDELKPKWCESESRYFCIATLGSGKINNFLIKVSMEYKYYSSGDAISYVLYTI